MREPLAQLVERYQNHITQMERIASISDGYQSVLRESTQSLTARYQRQLRQLEKIVRISDHYQAMMRDLNEALRIASTHDHLTSLPNRRLLIERLTAEDARDHRHSTTFSLIAVDIDGFKRINDEFGHNTGDTILVNIARALTAELRAYDVCARWGGEEFLILLPRTSGTVAYIIAERLRLRVEALRHEDAAHGKDDLRATVSIGVAEHKLDLPFDETIKSADNAMYQAKRAGRNRVVLAE